MRHCHLLLILPIAILAACGEAGTTDDPAQPPIDPAFWANIQCDSLDGLAFAITYYLDNKAQGNDVLRIQDNMLTCEAGAQEGVGAAEFHCSPDKPGSVRVKSVMRKGTERYRRWVFTLSQGMIDGMVDIQREDGTSVTQTFAGRLTR